MKGEIKQRYCELALDYLDQVSKPYVATRKTAQELYAEYPEVSNRRIRQITSEFRTCSHPYNIKQKAVENYLEGVQGDKIVDKGQEPSKKEHRLEDDLSVSETSYCDVGDYTVYQFDHREGLVKVNQEIRDEILFLYCEEGFTKTEVLNELEHPYLIEDDVQSIVSIHNKSHKSTPFTLERLEKLSLDEMVKDTKQRKENLYKKQSQKDEKPFEYFMDRMETPEIHIEPLNLTVQNSNQDDWAWFVPITDLHLGARSVDSDMGLENQINVLEKIFKKNLQDSTSVSLPNQVKLMLMGDTFHTDNSKETTWYGTPLETCADHDRIIHEGHALILRLIEACKQVADTEVILVKGNHDRDVTVSLAAHLYDIADERDFVFDPILKEGIYAERQYFTYGQNLVGATHQRNESLKDLDSIMIREADHLLESGQHRYFFGADKHTELNKDDYPSGMKFYRNAKLGPLDHYESQNGYYSRSGLRSFGFDPEHGKVSTQTTWVSEVI